ncbi:hypothetical protein AAHC03_04631 [Spirometra sp. Aus1]
MLEASNSKELQVNWTAFLSRNTSLLHDSIKLDSKLNSYGIILNEICTFNDTNDDAEITDLQLQRECLRFLGKNLQWNHTVTRNARSITFLYTANHSLESRDHFGKDGIVIVNITIPKSAEGLQGKEDFSLVPGRGISLELTVKNLLLEERTRVAPILLAFSEQPLEEDENFVSALEIDRSGQETLMNLFLARRRKVESYGYTGMRDLLGIRESDDRTPAFIQWRTTCQVENSSSPSASRQVHAGPQLRVAKSYAKKYSHSLPYALYGDRFNQQQQQTPIGLRLQAITFGTPKDGFYMKTGYVSWQAILSMDDPTRGGDYRLASILGATISVVVMAFVLPLAIFAALRYKRRLQSPPQEDRQPILDSNDNTEHRNPSESPFGILLSCGGRLRICRKIQSPDPGRDSEIGGS